MQLALLLRPPDDVAPRTPKEPPCKQPAH
jgi:hypothetical protein